MVRAAPTEPSPARAPPTRRGARSAWGGAERPCRGRPGVAGLSPLRAVARRDPGGARGGTGGRPADVRGRAARRHGGPEGAAVRRAGRPALRPRPGPGRRAAGGRLRHQRGQALQARAPGQAAAAQDAISRGGEGLPLVAGGRAPAGEAQGHRVPRCDRRQRGVRPRRLGDARARPGARRWRAGRSASSPCIRPSCCASRTRRARPRSSRAFVRDLEAAYALL